MPEHGPYERHLSREAVAFVVGLALSWHGHSHLSDSSPWRTGCVNCASPGLWGCRRVSAGSTRKMIRCLITILFACCCSAAEPVLIILERNPWLMVIG